MCEQAFFDGLETGAKRAQDEGAWVLMAGDMNVWMGEEQENDEHRRDCLSDPPADALGIYMADMLRELEMVSANGRRGKAEATRYYGHHARPTEIDYITFSVGLLPKLQATMSQLRLSELSDHRIFKVRFDADFMQERVASPRVQPAREVLLVPKLGEEEVHASTISAAEDVFGGGSNDEWDIERSYQAYKEVEERAAPKAKVGSGGVSRGVWAWYVVQRTR
jgi:hypothetical protein